MLVWWWGWDRVFWNSGEDSSSEEEEEAGRAVASDVVEVTRGEKAEKGFCQFMMMEMVQITSHF
jgi:hypothetical protein